MPAHTPAELKGIPSPDSPQYRPLGPDEVIQEGDEILMEEWEPVLPPLFGTKMAREDMSKLRRPLIPTPEPKREEACKMATLPVRTPETIREYWQNKLEEERLSETSCQKHGMLDQSKWHEGKADAIDQMLGDFDWFKEQLAAANQARWTAMGWKKCDEKKFESNDLWHLFGKGFSLTKDLPTPDDLITFVSDLRTRAELAETKLAEAEKIIAPKPVGWKCEYCGYCCIDNSVVPVKCIRCGESEGPIVQLWRDSRDVVIDALRLENAALRKEIDAMTGKGLVKDSLTTTPK